MEQKRNYDFVLWDVDGTLLDFLRSERYALTDCLNYYKLPVSEEIIAAYSAINDKCWKKLERGEVEKSWVLIHRFEEFFEFLHIANVDVREFQKRYQYKLGCVFYFQDHALELLTKLKKDFKQYIVTNGVEDTQRRKLKLSGIADLMDDIFISQCMGYEKPNPRFFEKCQEKIEKDLGKRIDKSRMLIVGDSLTSDMKGGNQFGIHCCYYHRGFSAEAFNEQEGGLKKAEGQPFVIDGVKLDYMIGNLWEVEQILWQSHQIKN